MFKCCRKKKPRTVEVPAIEPPEENEWEPVKPGDTLLTNGAGISLIMEFEGFHEELLDDTLSDRMALPYLDPVGIPTIGYGTIIYPNGKKVTMKDKPITHLEAIQYLRHEIDEKENVIAHFLAKIGRTDLKNNQFAALVSFAYNVGPGPIITTGKSMNRALKSRDNQAVADAFLLYDKATKRFGPFRRKVRLPGLTRRRQAERRLFLKRENG